jgi:hypothetical protein
MPAKTAEPDASSATESAATAPAAFSTVMSTALPELELQLFLLPLPDAPPLA